MTFGLRRAKMLGLLLAQLVSKIFKLCGHDPPTSQTDGQTDDMRSQDRALHYSASRGKKVVTDLSNALLSWVCRSIRLQFLLVSACLATSNEQETLRTLRG